MKINISDCDLSQSLYTLINCCSTTGNVTISLYEKESNWINANGAVPFLYQKGTMQWRVPLEKVQLSDLVKTFQMNAGNIGQGRVGYGDRERFEYPEMQ